MAENDSTEAKRLKKLHSSSLEGFRDSIRADAGMGADPLWGDPTIDVTADPVNPIDVLVETQKALKELENHRRAQATHSAAAQVAIAPTGTLASPKNSELFDRVAKILANPQGHPTMSRQEVQEAIGKGESTVERYLTEGMLKKAKASGRITTASVLKLLREDDSAE